MRSGCVRGRGGRLRWDRSGRWVPWGFDRLRDRLRVRAGPGMTSSGQALAGRRDVGRLERGWAGAIEYGGLGLTGGGVTLVRGCCWVPHSTSSGQALRGRRDDGGTEGAGRGLGAAWDVFSRSGECVQFWGPMCPVFGANVSSFWPNVFSFEGNVSTLAGDVSSFRRGALVGDGARTEGEIPRLRCAALGNDNSGGGGALGMRAWTG